MRRSRVEKPTISLTFPCSGLRTCSAPPLKSNVSLLQLVPNHDICLFEAIPRLCSSSPRMPWMVSPCRHPTAIATRSAHRPTSILTPLLM
jgi:hypothetical protein